ncbi:hypothetical protein GVAV_001485 [Gurleya vavrai]
MLNSIFIGASSDKFIDMTEEIKTFDFGENKFLNSSIYKINDFHLQKIFTCDRRNLQNFINTEVHKKLDKDKHLVLIPYYKIRLDDLNKLFFLTDQKFIKFWNLTISSVYDFIINEFKCTDIQLYESKKLSIFTKKTEIIEKNVYDSNQDAESLKQNTEIDKIHTIEIAKEKLMRNLIFNNTFYFIIDIYVDLIINPKFDYMCVFYFDIEIQKFNNHFITINRYKTNLDLTAYENDVFYNRNLEIQKIIAMPFISEIDLKKGEDKVQINFFMKNFQDQILILIKNIYSSYDYINKNQYTMKHFEKNKIYYEQVLLINQVLWDEIKELVSITNTWYDKDICNINHLFQKPSENTKRYKWMIEVNSEFEIYVRNGKFCIISRNNFIGKNFEWEDQVLISSHTKIKENTKIGFNTIIFPYCQIGKYVKIGKNNFFHEKVCIADFLNIEDSNIFGKNFCVNNSFFTYDLDKKTIIYNNKDELFINSKLNYNNEKLDFFLFKSKLTNIGCNNHFGDNVVFSKFFYVGNDNIFGRNIKFLDNCEIRDGNIIGNGCFFVYEILIYRNNYIIPYFPITKINFSSNDNDHYLRISNKIVK